MTSLRILALFAALCSAACSSVGSSAVRTDGASTQKHHGPVRIYAVVPPSGVRVVGMVEVHAIDQEANVETLMPVFMKRVADIGGTGGVIERLVTHYEMRMGYRTESYAIPCGHGRTCWSTRSVPYQYQVRILSIQGRALLPVDTIGPPASNTPPTIPPTAPTATPTAPPTGGTPQ